jgi:hypothetical protein
VRGAREAERRERERERGARERERAHQAPRAIEAESTESTRVTINDAVAEPHYERHADDTERAIKRRASSAAATELEDRLASDEEDIRASKRELDIAYDEILRIPEGKDKDAAIVEFLRHHDEIERAYREVKELGVRGARLEDIRKAYSYTQMKKDALHNRFVRVIKEATTGSVDGHEIRAALMYDDAMTGGTSPYRKAYDAFARESTKLREAVEAEVVQQAQQAERDTHVVESALARLTDLKTEVRGIVGGEDLYDTSADKIVTQIGIASQLVASIQNANPIQQQSEGADALLRDIQACHTDLTEKYARATRYAERAEDLRQQAKLIAQNASGSRLEDIPELIFEIRNIQRDIQRIPIDKRYPDPYIDAAIDATEEAIERMQEKALSDIGHQLRSSVAGTGAYEQSIQSLEELSRTAASFPGIALQDVVLRIQDAKKRLEALLANAKNNAESARAFAEQARHAALGAKDGDSMALIAELKSTVDSIDVDPRYSEGESMILEARIIVDTCVRDVQAPKAATPDASEEGAESLRPGLRIDSGIPHEEATPSGIATPIATSAEPRAAAKTKAKTKPATSAEPRAAAKTKAKPKPRRQQNTQTSRTTVSTMQLSEAPAPVKDLALKLESALKFALQPPSDASQEARASVTSASVQASMPGAPPVLPSGMATSVQTAGKLDEARGDAIARILATRQGAAKATSASIVDTKSTVTTQANAPLPLSEIETDATKQARLKTLAEHLERRVKNDGDQRADTGDAATSPSTGSNIRVDMTGVPRAKPAFLADIASRKKGAKKTLSASASAAGLENSAPQSSRDTRQPSDLRDARDNPPDAHDLQTAINEANKKIEEARLAQTEAQQQSLDAAANLQQVRTRESKYAWKGEKKKESDQRLEEAYSRHNNANEQLEAAKVDLRKAEEELQTLKSRQKAAAVIRPEYQSLADALGRIQRPQTLDSEWDYDSGSDSDFGSTRRRGAMFV